MRVISQEGERTREQFVEKKQHFHRVSNIEKEVVFFLDSPLNLKLNER